MPDETIHDQGFGRDEIQRLAGLGIWRYDVAARAHEGSPNFMRLLGYGPDERIDPEELFSGIPPADRAVAQDNIERLSREPGSISHEHAMTLRDGTVRHVWTNARSMRNADGVVTEIRGIMQDVTARVLATQALRESERERILAAELAPQIPWTAAPDGSIVGTSRRWTEITGIPADEALGTGWTKALHSDDLPHTLLAFSTSLRSGEPVDVEYRLRIASGEWRWMRAYAAPHKDENGRIIRWYGSLEDVHVRKAAERTMVENAERFQALVSATGSVVWHEPHDADPSLADWAMEDVFGPDSVWRGRWIDAIHPDDRDEAVSSWLECRSSGMAYVSVHRLLHVSGAYRWVRERVVPIGDADGSIREWVGLITDITDARAAEEATDVANARMAAILESTSDNVVGLDRNWIVTFVNGNAARLVGPDSKLKVGTSIWAAYPDLLGTDFHLNYEKVLSEGVPVRFESFFLEGGLWLDVHAYPTSDGISIFFRDVTQERRNREAMARLAHHDTLTGLANRARFNEQLARSISTAGPGELAVILLDLDDFKEVNDTLGHPVGDALLKEISRRFSAIASEAGLLARLGGDEFAVVHAVPQSRIPPQVLAERFVEALREPVLIDGNIVPAGVSVGIALTNGRGQDPDELFGNADVALYEAKAAGGNAFRLYEPSMHDKLRARQSMRHDMATAMERGEFDVHYQPQVDAATGRITGHEALVRWNHPVRGSVSPSEFVPLAEETGRIGEIGDWILERACADAAELPGDTTIAVNLSPMQMRDDSLPLKVASILARTGLARGRLELEITESVLLVDGAANIRMLHEIRGLGVLISLDDFGTGYSSLGYLRNFPFDKIKIDRSFVEDIGAGNHSEAIIKAVVGLGHAMGMTIAAEGVETEAQLAWLREIGCDTIQGYLTGRPRPLTTEAEGLSVFG